MLGVVREQPQYHLQAAPAGAQQRGPGATGSMSLAGSLAGMSLRAATAAARALRARVIFFCAPGMAAFFAAAVIAGSASSPARARSAAASVFSASRTAAFAFLRAGLSTILVFVSMRAM